MDPFIGSIIMFAGNFAPRGWAFCDGQILAINSNTALFSILGTEYGGDGRTTFALPDLRGRMPMHAGAGPGLTRRTVGDKGGAEIVTLTQQQMPTHTHSLRAATGAPSEDVPTGQSLASGEFFNSANPSLEMQSGSVGSAGVSQPVSILPPFQAVNFIIALQGTYPSRE